MAYKKSEDETVSITEGMRICLGGTWCNRLRTKAVYFAGLLVRPREWFRGKESKLNDMNE